MRLIGAGAPRGVTRAVRDDVLTWANLATVLRLLGLPLFAWLVLGPGEYRAAIWVLVVIGATDWVDGYLARRLDQVSRFGAALDPIADRLMIVTVTLVLAAVGIVPWWVLVAIVVPDLTLGLVALVKFHGNPEVPVTIVGKVRTALLMLGLPVMLLARTFDAVHSGVYVAAEVVVFAGCAGHWIAAGQYLRAMLSR
ncbi:cardiolipin synthase [Sediminihabitans luteus]|uniref:Cardiolipin synthase n=1 Tax=Sediminihabitans luteus TaxID=1138585 RepID=A0A2M9D0V8_9CELL|nr:CDP-alcohol phosphatidyltransferase family protein [Sediminihabitans luteus]PJJ77826.1 cardiolipin synthase [Sediminihabitans luteus]GII99816.1 hypothetical protein Slu03_21940 [Sediminihabitans luteus]